MVCLYVGGVDYDLGGYVDCVFVDGERCVVDLVVVVASECCHWRVGGYDGVECRCGVGYC